MANDTNSQRPGPPFGSHRSRYNILLKMASPTTHAIIGTAGHIDHGKTALIKALTGQDTDRLKEEKERGISIDLGFAYFTLPDGTAPASSMSPVTSASSATCSRAPTASIWCCSRSRPTTA